MLSVMDEYLACFVILPKKKKKDRKRQILLDFLIFHFD